jgi:hypothetical protein
MKPSSSRGVNIVRPGYVLAMGTARRAAAWGALAAAAAAFVALAGGCGSATSTVDPVAQAADATTRAGGARVALSGTVSATGLSQPVTLAGSGSFNLRAGEGTFAMTFSGLPQSAQKSLHGAPAQMIEVFRSNVLYMSSPLFGGKLPSGARWLKLDLGQVKRAMGLGAGSLTSGTDPTQYLKDLRGSAGGVTVVGHEPVRGVPTTRYSGTIDLLKAAEREAGANRAQARAAMQKLIEKTGTATEPVQVWVDAHGLVRRIAQRLSVKAGAHPVTTSFQIEFFDFGATPVVTPPASSETFDATGQAVQGLGSG